MSVDSLPARYFEITDQSRQSIEKRNSFDVFGSMPARMGKVTFQLPAEHGVDDSEIQLALAQSMPTPGLHGHALVGHELSSSAVDAAVEVSRASHPSLNGVSGSADAHPDASSLAQTAVVRQSSNWILPLSSPDNV
jgi:hypothetical protein